jgi:hypothetical protein
MPAVSICKVYGNGTKIWRNFKEQYHRENGPAIEDENGDRFWFINDKLHRLDGPAAEFADGSKEWFLDDILLPVKSQKEFESYLKLKAFW